MLTRAILGLLMAIAVLVAPLSMVGATGMTTAPMAGKAIADHGMTMENCGHSSGEDDSDQAPCGTNDCIATCSTLTSVAPLFAAVNVYATNPPASALLRVPQGRLNDFEPPPPRSA